MEIRHVYVKTRSKFGKQCIFSDYGPTLDACILPDPSEMKNYIRRQYCNKAVQHSKQFAVHQLQTYVKESKQSGTYHFEGGWPKEINPMDEEATMRFRRRIEKDDYWAPKLHPLFKKMEHTILQNGTVNIYQHYFDDMIPIPMVQSLGFRILNVYKDPETPKRPVTNISWSPDSRSRIVICYCFLDYGWRMDYSNKTYIWQVENPNQPYFGLDPPHPCVCCEFNPRDPSVLVSGLITGQVCSWDVRTGSTPVQISHLQFSHREYANSVKWMSTKVNTEFYSTSTDGRVMWWDTRYLRQPVDVLMFDLEYPNEPLIDRAVGISCLNFSPVGSKYMFGMENGLIVTGSRKMKTNAEKLATRYEAHFGPICTVDRNTFNPGIFLSVGDWRARVWADDTKEGNLCSTLYMQDYPTGGCWNKMRHSVFYVTTTTGRLLVWDVLQNLHKPIFTLKLGTDVLTCIAPCEEGVFLAIGNRLGSVYLVEPTDFFRKFDRKDRTLFSEFLERSSKVAKAVDMRLREIKFTHKKFEESKKEDLASLKLKAKGKAMSKKKPKKVARTSIVTKAQKEKKKIRDDIGPEVLEAEEKYFEEIEKRLAEYANESDQSIVPVFQPQPVAKKSERKRKKSRAKEVDKMKEPKGEKSARSLKKSRSKMDMSLMLQEEQKKEQSLPSHVKEGTTKKKTKKRIKFKLPVPCKGEICRPKVCCWRSSRKEDRRRRPSKRRLTEEVTPDVRRSRILMKQQRKLSQILREMKESPTQLKCAAAKAKEEIRRQKEEAKRRRTKRISEMKKELADGRGKRTTLKKMRSESLAHVLSYKLHGDKDDQSIDEEPKEEQKEKPIHIDPYVLYTGKKNFQELFTLMLGISPKLTKERMSGRKYLEEYYMFHRRVYPRISEFGATEIDPELESLLSAFWSH